MKTTKLLLAAASVLALYACGKESTTIDNPSATTAFKEGQEVTIGVSSGKVSTKVTGTDNGTNINLIWEEGDKIKVTVGSKSATFTLKSGKGTSSATFTGTMPDKGDEFDIAYPVDAPDLASQVHVEGKIPSGKLSFTAEGCTLDKVATLEATNSVLQLNLTGSQAISMIVVETVDASTAKSYTLRTSGVTLSSTATSFFVVTDPISEKLKMTVYDNTANSPAAICNFTTTDAINLGTGTCVNMPTKEVKKEEPVFSVSATKKVKFTKGNLWWDGSEWHLEDSQTAYPTEWSTDHVGHFYWTKDAAKSYAEFFSDGTITISDVPFFADSKGGLTVDGQSGLYALSIDEWMHLLSTRGTGDTYFKTGVTVGTATNCLVIAPDGYSGKIASSYSAEEWATAEASGLVCLPAAGYRDDSNLSGGDSNGRFWSATLYEYGKNFAYRLQFSSDEFSLEENNRSYGCSVRLVSTVSQK